MPNTYQKISAESQSLIVQYLQMCHSRMPLSTARDRFERIDRAIQLEMKERRNKIPHYYNDITMPVVKSPVRKISNFLIDMFVDTPSIFEAVSTEPERADAVKQMNAVIEENAKVSKWAREMVLFLKDLPKYNMGGMEVEWKEAEISTLAASSNPSSNTADVKAASRAGNVLKRLDVYNLFYDTSIPVNEVTAHGDYIGYNEQYSATRWYKYLADLRTSLGVSILMNEKMVLSNNGPIHYYRPAINTQDSVAEELSPMEQLFQGHGNTVDMTATTKGQQMGDPTKRYEVQVFYARIVPKMFKIKVPSADKIQIWKFHVVNWTTLVAAEKLTNAHSIFPCIMCQIDEEGIDDQVKSAAELLLPLQNLSTKYYDARMRGLKRGVIDRGLYNPNRIDKKHLDDDNPSANIPVKPNMLQPGLDNAYRQIPFNDNLGPTLLNELSYLETVAQRTSGLNDPQQGRFQKGNKTLGEFSEVMQNADDDLRTWAKLVESVGISSIKYIIKINTLQYQAGTSISSPTTGGSLTIDPIALRQASLDFKMADGLITKDALMDMPTARGFFELLLQSPQLQKYYGEQLPQLVDYIFTSTGFDTTKFKGANPQALAPQVGGQPPQQ